MYLMKTLKIMNKNNSDQYFYIDQHNANLLEIAFNLSEKGKEWKGIGDNLYNFSISAKIDELLLTKEKFHFLRILANEKNIKKFNRKKDIN